MMHFPPARSLNYQGSVSKSLPRPLSAGPHNRASHAHLHLAEAERYGDLEAKRLELEGAYSTADLHKGTYAEDYRQLCGQYASSHSLLRDKLTTAKAAGELAQEENEDLEKQLEAAKAEVRDLKARTYLPTKGGHPSLDVNMLERSVSKLQAELKAIHVTADDPESSRPPKAFRKCPGGACEDRARQLVEVQMSLYDRIIGILKRKVVSTEGDLLCNSLRVCSLYSVVCSL